MRNWKRLFYYLIINVFVSACTVVTVLTMLAAVACAVWGLKAVRLPSIERFSEAITGSTIMFCGLSIAVLGL